MSSIKEIIAPAMTRRQARAALVAAGWAWVAGGSFAAVYGSPDGTRVAKVTKPDAGAEATYHLAEENAGNPHFPVYLDRIALDQGGIVYEVERLEPVEGYGGYSTAQADNRARFADTYQAAWDAVYEAIGDEEESGLGDDDHWRNVMLRPTGEIVLTDVIYGDGYVTAYATVSGGQADHGELRDSYRPGSCHYPAALYGTNGETFDGLAA